MHLGDDCFSSHLLAGIGKSETFVSWHRQEEFGGMLCGCKDTSKDRDKDLKREEGTAG